MAEHRSVLVLFLEATIKAPPSTWPYWHLWLGGGLDARSGSVSGSAAASAHPPEVSERGRTGPSSDTRSYAVRMSELGRGAARSVSRHQGVDSSPAGLRGAHAEIGCAGLAG
jgi:hypothetical protein